MTKENRDELLWAILRCETEEVAVDALNELLEYYEDGELYELFLKVYKTYRQPNMLAALFIQIAPVLFHRRSYVPLGDLILKVISAIESEGVAWVKFSKYVAQALLDAGFYTLLSPDLTYLCKVRQEYYWFVERHLDLLKDASREEVIGVAYGVAVAHGFHVLRAMEFVVENNPVASAAVLDCALRWRKHGGDASVEHRLVEQVNFKHAPHYYKYPRLRSEFFEYLLKHMKKDGENG